jgi:hypothetical protein
VRPKYRRIKANQKQPIVEKSRILPCAEVRSYRFAREEEPISDARQPSQIRVNSQLGLLGDLELDRLTGLALPDRGSIDGVTAGRNIRYPKSNQVTPSQLAINRQIEESEISLLAEHVESGSDCPDVFW